MIEVHDHVRDGRDGGYGVVVHLRDKEVDGQPSHRTLVLPDV